MASYRDVITGLRIFALHDGEEQHGLSAEHGKIYAGHVRPDELSEAEAKALDEAGWTWCKEYECWRRYA
jgi:hypothetical protein